MRASLKVVLQMEQDHSIVSSGSLEKAVVHVWDLRIRTSLKVFSLDTEADNQQKTLFY